MSSKSNKELMLDIINQLNSLKAAISQIRMEIAKLNQRRMVQLELVKI